MFVGKLVANGFLREEAGAGDGGANGGGGAGGGSLLAGAGGAGEARDGGDGLGGSDGDGNGGGGEPAGAGVALRYDVGDEAAMLAWREALGMNRDFDGEGFLPAAPEGLPEGVWDAEAVEVLGRKAWELGVPKEAFAGVVGEFAARSAEAQKVAEAAESERVAGVARELKVLWGDGYEQHMRGAVRGVEQLCRLAGLADGVAAEVVNNPAVGSDANMVRLLAHVGAMLGDGGARGLGASGSGSVNAAEADRIMNDPGHPLHEAFMDASHSNHRYANEVYDRLAFGGK